MYINIFLQDCNLLQMDFEVSFQFLLKETKFNAVKQ